MFRDATCSPDPGSGVRDRSENVRRAGAPAMMRPGTASSCWYVIAPYRAVREEARAAHAAAGIGYLEVWVDHRWRCACGAT